jgi:chemotaxis methyl-accepting protein methylase
MSLLDFVKMETYYDYLKQKILEGSVAQDSLIGVTRFFRDEEAFDSLKKIK